ncbi:MAG: hypothetical protein F6K31_26980 [Symploca sp. SIO2G7]|nr:hypothetical protein [Symploca sp. SIO2G7]
MALSSDARSQQIPDFFYQFVKLTTFFNQEVGDFEFGAFIRCAIAQQIPDFFYQFVKLITFFNQEVGDFEFGAFTRCAIAQ